MAYLLRIEGESEPIEEIRRRLVADGAEVSESHKVQLDSKQLSTPWTSPEVIEILKFVTTVLQTVVAGYSCLKLLRDALNGQQAVLVQRQDSGAQLKITRDTDDGVLKEFCERDGEGRA